MKKIVLFAATMACMASCQNQTSKTPAIDPANFDLSVAPNVDFYQYATGGWQARNPLKPEYSRFGSFDVIAENNQKRINDLFQEMTKLDAAKGSVEQKISDLYKMGLDSARLNAEGAAPIEAGVRELLSLTDRDRTEAVARLHHTVANPFFGVGVQADLMNSDVNALYISQSGLTMGDRDYYLEPENENIRTAYKEYLKKIFRLAGLPEAELDKAVAGVMDIETKLAEKSWSNVELRNIPAQYNPPKRADFEKTYDAVDWAAYYKTMGIGDFETIIVTTPSAIAAANDLMKNAPIEELRYYLAAQYINAAASYLSDEFQQASFDFYGKVMSGQQEQKPRWKRAMSVPNGTLGEAVGEMYVAKYFPAEDKARMTELVEELLDISKIDMGRQRLTLSETDIRELLYDGIRAVEPAADSSIAIVPVFPEEPVMVSCDDTRLRRAVTNILSNGVRYARSELRLTCRADRRQVTIRIQDDGDGIAEADLPHIFDRFYMGKSGKSGIGLALTKEIVHLHRGTIRAYNGETGAVFEITLPMGR